ncbi:MAG: hypothetical protein AB8C84_00550 [Oligoflexales bacterium]
MQSSYQSYCVVEERLTASFRRLGVEISAHDVELRASRIFRAMSKPSRVFHGVYHVLELSAHVDALGCLAALYHDFIYLQLDHGFGEFAEHLRDTCRYEQGRVYLQPVGKEDVVLAGVCEIFGVPLEGGLLEVSLQNEFVSALVAVCELHSFMTPRDLFMIATCIEATIPFREESVFPNSLVKRLGTAWKRLDVPMADSDIDEAMFRAVDLANRDVLNFSSEQVEEFLKNTWALISEGSPEILEVSCSVRACRIAIYKMFDFLNHLQPQQIYHSYKRCPPDEELLLKTQMSEKNLILARLYLMAQLCALNLLDAVSVETGGNTLLIKYAGHVSSYAEISGLEQELLKQASHVDSDVSVDPVLMKLLQSESLRSSIFIYTSPIAGYLYGTLGHKGLMDFYNKCRLYMDGDKDSFSYLKDLPQKVILSVVNGVGNVATLRKPKIIQLTKQLQLL